MMPRKRRRAIKIVLLLLVLLYLIFPLVAGFIAIGDMRGPVIYPSFFHKALYVLGWESSPWAEGSKPRVPYPGWATARPWFYGLPQHTLASAAVPREALGAAAVWQVVRTMEVHIASDDTFIDDWADVGFRCGEASWPLFLTLSKDRADEEIERNLSFLLDEFGGDAQEDLRWLFAFGWLFMPQSAVWELRHVDSPTHRVEIIAARLVTLRMLTDPQFRDRFARATAWSTMFIGNDASTGANMSHGQAGGLLRWHDDHQQDLLPGQATDAWIWAARRFVMVLWLTDRTDVLDRVETLEQLKAEVEPWLAWWGVHSRCLRPAPGECRWHVDPLVQMAIVTPYTSSRPYEALHDLKLPDRPFRDWPDVKPPPGVLLSELW